MIPKSSTMQSALLGYGLSDVLCFCVDHAKKIVLFCLNTFQQFVKVDCSVF
jgi:hypothetical protein